MQLSLLSLKNENKEVKTKNIITKDYTEEFFGILPFTPTNAQKRAVKEAIGDMQKGKQMNRLLQGDVGSGKTAIAAAIVYSSSKNGLQSALMAPTEVLATQHYETFVRLFSGTGIKCELLVGSTKAKDKKEIKERLKKGEIDLIIGTHALIQEDVEFERLGLVITDEQHRFGVKQRTGLCRFLSYYMPSGITPVVIAIAYSSPDGAFCPSCARVCSQSSEYLILSVGGCALYCCGAFG